jgi:hypothetical protein
MVAARIKPADIGTGETIGRPADDGPLDRCGDFGDRGGRQGPAVDRQPRAAICRPGNAQRLDRD